MLTLLEGYKGSIEVNGIAYSDLNAAVQAFKGSDEQLTIVLNRGAKIKDNQAQGRNLFRK